MATAMGLGSERLGLASPLQQPSDPGLADGESLGDLGTGVAAFIASGCDSNPQVHRVGHRGALLAPRIVEKSATSKEETL
jgi:hypothetical protein